MKQFFSSLHAAFPDLRMDAEDVIAEGDKVVQRWTATGTHDGDLMGIAPTGNRVEFTGMEISRISGGKVAEMREGYDAMGMMQQMGAIPSAEEQQA